jgi:molybdopterin converting factor subunit 1
MTLAETRVRILLFGYYREIAGSSELQLALPAGSRVDDLVAVIRSRPPFAELSSTPAVAVNRRYAPGTQLLSSGDEVALIPPMSGG